MAPGDPVLVVMGGDDSGNGQRADIINGEKAYESTARQLGLDKPSFYFLFTSMAYPDSLHKIKKRNHREMVTRLIDQNGNAEKVLDYFNQLKQFQLTLADFRAGSFETNRILKDNISALMNEYDKSTILYKINYCDSILELQEDEYSMVKLGFEFIKTAYDELISHPTLYKLYLPAFRWYGTESQYHTWMFGDYPWFSSVDSTPYYKVDSLASLIKRIVPQSIEAENRMSTLNGLLLKAENEIDEGVSIDSNKFLIASLKNEQGALIDKSLSLKKQFNQYNLERDSILKYLKDYSSKGFLRGDFGISYDDKKPVATKIKEAIYWTLIMNFFSILISYLISIPLGVRSALWKSKGKKVKDNINTTFLFILYSLPSFWIGTILLVFFTTPEYGEWLDWFPTNGAQDYNLKNDPNASAWAKLCDILHHLTLPIFCITYGSLAYLSRQMRGSMLGVLRQDYIRTAWSKGLGEQKVIWKHAFRNSLFPIITLFSSVFPRALSGSIAIEMIYAVPGMGWLVLASITARDWPVVFTIVMFAAILTMIGNLIADILYAFVDPRISFK